MIVPGEISQAHATKAQETSQLMENNISDRCERQLIDIQTDTQ